MRIQKSATLAYIGNHYMKSKRNIRDRFRSLIVILITYMPKAKFEGTITRFHWVFFMHLIPEICSSNIPRENKAI